jgi:hypothetical protein
MLGVFTGANHCPVSTRIYEMTTITLTAAEISTLLHLVSYNERQRAAGIGTALLDNYGSERAVFEKLLVAGADAGVDVFMYT